MVAPKNPDDLHRFVEIRLENFKAFTNFRMRLNAMNVIVGPNNAGKSTVLAAFRILASAHRRASARKAEIVTGPNGQTYGHKVSLIGLSVADENIFHDYNDEDPANLTFTLSNKNRLILFFAEIGSCVLIPEIENGTACVNPATFRKEFNCSIGFVPILGPVEHNEIRYEKEAARLALFSYGAARNFRNIWHHFSGQFAEFRSLIKTTWPGMDINPPEAEYVDGKLRLFMYCPEQRRDRELFWAGFGFQVWCQMVTHIIQSNAVSLFLIDEPDIYLHSDLQRQLLTILRDMDADIIIATHSTEILSEAEFDEIVVVDKSRRSASRVKDANQLSSVFATLGSNLNPVLTQISKTKKVLFVEGYDFQILGRLASIGGFPDVGARSKFAVVPIKGFNPQKVKNLLEGIKSALGFTPQAACVLDRDYRSDRECKRVEEDLKACCEVVKVLDRKEIENYLLLPPAIDRAAKKRLAERAKRQGEASAYTCDAEAILNKFCEDKKNYVYGQYVEMRRQFENSADSGLHGSNIAGEEIGRLDKEWDEKKLWLVPGKEGLSFINSVLQAKDGISLTPFGIIQCLAKNDVPSDLVDLFNDLKAFTS
jgi:energy-coupling factor transporter ATP-binding protein EcfA2